jgi:Mitochondrial carrier protein
MSDSKTTEVQASSTAPAPKTEPHYDPSQLTQMKIAEEWVPFYKKRWWSLSQTSVRTPWKKPRAVHNVAFGFIGATMATLAAGPLRSLDYVGQRAVRELPQLLETLKNVPKHSAPAAEKEAYIAAKQVAEFHQQILRGSASSNMRLIIGYGGLRSLFFHKFSSTLRSSFQTGAAIALKEWYRHLLTGDASPLYRAHYQRRKDINTMMAGTVAASGLAGATVGMVQYPMQRVRTLLSAWRHGEEAAVQMQVEQLQRAGGISQSFDSNATRQSKYASRINNAASSGAKGALPAGMTPQLAQAQTAEELLLGPTAGSRAPQSMPQAAARIFKNHGISGFYTGAGNTVFRTMTHAVLFFGVYDVVQGFVYSDSSRRSFGSNLALGMGTALVANVAVLPFSTLSKIQADPTRILGKEMHHNQAVVEYTKLAERPPTLREAWRAFKVEVPSFSERIRSMARSRPLWVPMVMAQGFIVATYDLLARTYVEEMFETPRSWARRQNVSSD